MLHAHVPYYKLPIALFPLFIFLIITIMASSVSSANGEQHVTPDPRLSRIGGLTLPPGANNYTCMIHDEAHGLVYIGTKTKPGLILKVDLDNGAEGQPAIVDQIMLQDGEDNLNCAAVFMDPQGNHYAWFGTKTAPGRVIRIKLNGPDGHMRREGALTLHEGEDNLLCAALNVSEGYLLFGTGTSPGRVIKVGLGSHDAPNPQRLGALTLADGENLLQCVVLDDRPTTSTAHGAGALFGTGTSPGQVVRVDPAAMTRIGALTLNSGENNLKCALVDLTAGQAWFGGVTPYQGSSWGDDGALVVKVGLGTITNSHPAGPPIRINSVIGEELGGCLCAVRDKATGYGYFGACDDKPHVVKVDHGAGAAAPAVLGAAELYEYTEDRMVAGAIDSAAGVGYFATAIGPEGDASRLVKVDLGKATEPPSRTGASLFGNSGDCEFEYMVIDSAGEYVYCTTSVMEQDSRLVKFHLGDSPEALPEWIGSIDLGEWVSCLTIDRVTGYLYVGVESRYEEPSQILKIDPAGGPGGLPAVVAALDLPKEFGDPDQAFVAEDLGLLFVGVNANSYGEGPFCRVVKVALGKGDAAPRLLSSLELPAIIPMDEEENQTYNRIMCALYDPATSCGLVGIRHGAWNSAFRICKIALGAGETSPTLLTTLDVTRQPEDPEFGSLTCAALDVGTGYAYFGTRSINWYEDVDLTSGVFKIATRGAETSCTLTNKLFIPGLSVWSALIDSPSGIACFGTDDEPAHILKVALGKADEPPMLLKDLILEPNESDADSVVFNTRTGVAVFGLDTNPGHLTLIQTYPYRKACAGDWSLYR